MTNLILRVVALTALVVALAAAAFPAGADARRRPLGPPPTPERVAAVAQGWWAKWWGYPTHCPTPRRVTYDPAVVGMFAGGYAYDSNYEADVACTWAISPVVEAALASRDRYERSQACWTIFHEMGHLAGLDHDFTGARGIMMYEDAAPPRKCQLRSVIG